MRVVFIGTGEIGLPVLRWLLAAPEHELVGVVTQPDKPVGRAQRIEPTPIKAALDRSSISILQPERIKRPEAIAAIQALAPDVAVVMAYGQILPRAVLEIPRVACLNLHASLLPRHRGAAPIQAAIVAGDTESGITVMYMDEGLDTGDILLQRQMILSPNETGGSLHDRLGEMAPAATAEALSLLAAGNAPRVPQSSAEATYAPKLEREHGRIDWNDSAGAIERRIRAYNPWPGSYVLLQDREGLERKLKIFSAVITTEGAPSAGQLRATPDRGLVIGARDGGLQLQQVQLEGKKRMEATELMRGHPWLMSATIVPAPAANS